MRTLYIAVGAIIIAGIAFYGGMQYQQSSAQAAAPTFQGRNAGGGRGGGFGGGGSAFGTIVAKDATSVTIQLQSSSSTTQGTGSKIVFVDSTTQIGKFTTGTDSDLTVGQNVTVSGSSNSDGSITARMIQIRPANTSGFGNRNQ